MASARRASALADRNVLVVGSGARACRVQHIADTNPRAGLRVLGFVDDRDAPADASLAGRRVYRFGDVEEVFRREVVDEVVVACPLSLLPRIDPVVGLCAAVGVPVTILSDVFADCLPRPTRWGSTPALSYAAVHHHPGKLRIKRAIDVVLGSALLLLASPILLVAALGIKLTSHGPVLFRQVRCGLNGRRFRMSKLRTMYEDAESRLGELRHLNEVSGPVFKIREDPRATPIGRLLRRWSLDELPQLWNVVRGDMSLVGPRPAIPTEVERYHLFQRRRLSMRPGITCWWQVRGRSEIEFDEWVRLDLEYIDTWSLGQDLEILLRTVPAVLRATGAS
ncbi:MAG TPA: exopolysaccharide biosynthesis polyprenyl glycosylphosphotransferase [Myxococcota bacterium]|nr:exopolysaccharide biosynthesis polyprenyl glycosylphosphotransferase [Myxococcota bacterium]